MVVPELGTKVTDGDRVAVDGKDVTPHTRPRFTLRTINLWVLPVQRIQESQEISSKRESSIQGLPNWTVGQAFRRSYFVDGRW